MTRKRSDPLGPGGAIEEIAAGPAAPPLPEERLPTASELIVRAGIASWSLVGIFVVAGALILALRTIEVLLPPVIFALVLVLLLQPLVTRLVSRGVRRGIAVAVVYLALLAAIGGFAFVGIPAVVGQGQAFAADLPSLLEKGGSLAARVSQRLRQDELGSGIARTISDYVTENADLLPSQLSRFAAFGLRLAHFSVVIIVGLFLGIYVLLALPRMGVAFTRLVPAERRAQLAPISARLREVFTGFLRARLIISAVVGLVTGLGLWLVGMPFWLLLGVIVGLANLVPVLGSWIGGLPVLLVALVTKPPAFLLVVLVVLIVAHAIDGYVLSPHLMRQAIDMHPITVLLAVIVGGALLGVWGIFAAVPIVGALQVTAQEGLRRGRLASEAGEMPVSPVSQ